jgi:hypothetical protein
VDTVAKASRFPVGDHTGCVGTSGSAKFGTSGPGEIVMLLLPDSITTTEADRPVVYASLYAGTDDAGGSAINRGPVESEPHATAAIHTRACTGKSRRFMRPQICILLANEGWSAAFIMKKISCHSRSKRIDEEDALRPGLDPFRHSSFHLSRKNNFDGAWLAARAVCWALTAAACVVADSYRGVPWLAVRARERAA